VAATGKRARRALELTRVARRTHLIRILEKLVDDVPPVPYEQVEADMMWRIFRTPGGL
jgi:hypothetical protein